MNGVSTSRRWFRLCVVSCPLVENSTNIHKTDFDVVLRCFEGKLLT